VNAPEKPEKESPLERARRHLVEKMNDEVHAQVRWYLDKADANSEYWPHVEYAQSLVKASIDRLVEVAILTERLVCHLDRCSDCLIDNPCAGRKRLLAEMERK
jgi:hypothetical protein